jgi:FlaA1/EpsC-like NDP-sugar epimerase
MNILKLIGRDKALFNEDLNLFEQEISKLVNRASFLVIGGAGSIGRAVTKEIFKRGPAKLHIVDISENNMVELVRDLRSTIGYNNADFRTFTIDCGGPEFECLFENEGPYDYILNLSALKHVRSEKDQYTLMRMVQVNIFNTINTVKLIQNNKIKKYFCVSTDKAANPANMMGASKRIMELFLMRESIQTPISMARFANVAFSDGSLLDGFNKRFNKQQPITAPLDVRRYFVTAQESGELCLLSCLLGENREIFFPKLSERLHLISFADIAKRFLENLGYSAYECSSEDEAREMAPSLIVQKKWPCYFFKSDTTGEKGFEEFFTNNEILNMDKFTNIGIISNNPDFSHDKLDNFTSQIHSLLKSKEWNKPEMVRVFSQLIPSFKHIETGKNLDGRM